MKMRFPFEFGDGNGHKGNEALKAKLLRLMEEEMQKHVDDAGITGVKIEFDPQTSEIIATGENQEDCERALRLFADEEGDSPPEEEEMDN